MKGAKNNGKMLGSIGKSRRDGADEGVIPLSKAEKAVSQKEAWASDDAHSYDPK